jgi:hypothetical protein
MFLAMPYFEGNIKLRHLIYLWEVVTFWVEDRVKSTRNYNEEEEAPEIRCGRLVKLVHLKQAYQYDKI